MTFWDLCAPFYDLAEAANGRAYKKMLRVVRALVPSGSRVLECAAGTGAISLACADRAEEILCTDVSERMLDVARRKAAKQGAANIRFGSCDLYAIDQPDKSWDVVIAAQVLHLLNHPEWAAAELKRVAVKRIILPITLLENVGPLARVKVGLWRTLGFAPLKSFDKAGYRRFLAEIGLPVTRFGVIAGEMPMAVAVIELA